MACRAVHRAMLDHVSIFTKTGIVLWRKSMCKLKGNPVAELISTVLLEERGGQREHVLQPYKLKWAFVNELDLVFVCVYQSILSLLYVDELLESMKREFVAMYRHQLANPSERLPFDDEFDRLLKEAEIRAMHAKRSSSVKTLQPGQAGSQRSNGASGIQDEDAESDEKDGDGDDTSAGAGLDSESKPKPTGVPRHRRKFNKGGGSSSDAKGTATAKVTETTKRSKKPTVWHDSTARPSKKVVDELDRNKQTDGEDLPDENIDEVKATYLPDTGEVADWEREDTLDDDDADEGSEEVKTVEDRKGWNFSQTYLGSMLQSMTGAKVIEDRDLAPVLEQMRQNLMAKNVAAEIADNISDSVCASLRGQKLGSFTRLSTVVKDALQEAVMRVLTPNRNTDILREVLDAKAQGRPYVCVFVGVNGVGKSTSLAKVCYYLKQHNLSVMLAACDTFRSGAVEQLKVHSRCLEAPLFSQGYAKDPARVAAAAIEQARDENINVVLIDTAGRMQNKEPLMRALSKLISDNNPDLTLFVGEALVGNDGIDQLKMFNQALANYSPPGRSHQIDGIVLTKFDTINEKVGAALSMCYKSGKPIMFVGTGQKYTHLKKLNTAAVIKALFT